MDGIRGSQLQQVLRMARHQNSSDALVHALHFEVAKSATYINQSDTTLSVSYTHLDVYKRQVLPRTTVFISDQNT